MNQKGDWSLSVCLALLPTFVLAAPRTPQFHTRSIVACDPSTDQCGIAVVSFPTGVPAVVPVGEPGVVVANQSFPSHATARVIIEEIKMGSDAPTALASALAADPFASFRQFGVAALFPSSASGVSVATFSGADDIPEVCGLTGDRYAIQANLQSSPAVCAAMEAGFLAAQGSLPGRLLSALKAGTPVGRDARGEFSASIRVFSSSWILADITPVSADANVDRSAHWEAELEFSLNAYLSMLTPGDPADLVALTRRRAKAILKVLHQLGFYTGRVDGAWSAEAEAALGEFAAFNLFFPRETVIVGGVLMIDGPLADYIVQGGPRGVLTPKP